MAVEQAGFRSGRGTRNQIANVRWIMERSREFQKEIYCCFIDYSKSFDCVDNGRMWNMLKKVGIPTHYIALLRNLYSKQKATVRAEFGETVV